MRNLRHIVLSAVLIGFAASVCGEEEHTPELVVPPPADRPVESDAEVTEFQEEPAGEEVSAGKELLERRAREGDAETAVDDEPADSDESDDVSDSIAPPPFPLSRYQQLWERPPFHLESVAPPVESAGLAQRYALTGIAEISGEPIAFLMERATQNRMMVKKDEGDSGLTLVQIDLVQQKYDDSTVTVQQGAEVGVIRFDAGPAMPPQAMGMGDPRMSQAPGVPPHQAAVPPTPPVPVPGVAPGQTVSPGVPGQVPQQQGAQQGVQFEGAGAAPAVPGQVPANGGVQQSGGQPMPPPRVIRRRAIVPSAP